MSLNDQTNEINNQDIKIPQSLSDQVLDNQEISDDIQNFIKNNNRENDFYVDQTKLNDNIKHSIEIDNGENSDSKIDSISSNLNKNEWDPFTNLKNDPNPINSNLLITGELNSESIQTNLFDFKNDIEDSDWANFGNNHVASNETRKDNVDLIVKTMIPDHKNNNNSNNYVDDDDDDFADFVETTTIPSLVPQPSENPATVAITEIPIKTQLNTDVIITPKPIANISIDYDSLLEKLFQNVNENTKTVLNNFTKNPYSDSTNNIEYNIIDDNETWKQLKTYTSVTDASISLKFKWILSDLENDYLNSLNIERISNNQKSNILVPSVIKNEEVLKPVESASTVQKAVNQLPFESTADSLFETNKLEPSSKIEQTEGFSSNSLLVSPAFELDLSYFESKLDQKTVKLEPSLQKSASNHSFTSNSQNISGTSLSSNQPAQQNKSKIFLDKLLKDIFVNNKNDSIDPSPTSSKQNTRKDDDIQSDKKSISSSSSSSSFSNITELSIQLQPHKLEQQQYLDIIQTNQNNDKKKLEILSKLPNYVSSLNSNSSQSSIVFPQLKQLKNQDK